MLKAMFFIMTDDELAALGVKDKNVASFIAENADKAVQMSVSTEKTKTVSKAVKDTKPAYTPIRFTKRLGCTGYRKLDNRQVEAIKVLLATTATTQKDIAKTFKVSPATINSINKGTYCNV